MAITMRQALKELGKCTNKVAKLAPVPITADHLELIIGLGTCGDWLAWASRLRRLDFTTAAKRNSQRATSYLETTKFTFLWIVANSLFARDRILSLLVSAPLPIGELKRFEILYQAASLTSAEESAYLVPLHAILDRLRVPRDFPWATLPHIRVIDLIYYKYTPDSYKNRGEAAKAIQKVATGVNPVSSLNLPTLIYATRNWTLHGSLLNSSFRGSPKEYQTFMTTIIDAMVTILARTATAINSSL